MAVEVNKIATGAELGTIVPLNGYAKNLKYQATTVEVAAAASVSSTYTLARLPSSARLAGSGRLYWDDMATSGSPTMDLGIRGTGVTYDEDVINDGLVLSAVGAGVPVYKDIANYGKPLWQLAGLSQDPNTTFTLVGVIRDAAVIAGGTLTAELIYTTD